MTDPIRLQNRISDAFGEPQSRRAKIAPPPLAADDVFVKDGFQPPEKARQPWRVSLTVFGGLGLLASSVALGAGHAAGLYGVAGSLAAIGAIATLVHVWHRIRRSKVVAAAPVQPAITTNLPVAETPVGVMRAGPSEAQQDADWLYDESAAIDDSLHDALGDIVLTRDLEGRILETNGIFRQLTGRDAPQGQTCEALGLRFAPAEKAGCREVRIDTPRGERIFLWHDVTVRDRAGRSLLMRSLARDVTDERRLAIAREEARNRAEAASAAKSGLLATVSHEIRTPLGGILGMAGLLARTRLSPEQTSYIEGIRQSGEALGQLVDELLDCASIEAGRFTINPLVTEVRPFIEGVSEMLAHRAHGKGLEIGTAIVASVPETLEFDSARVRQVLFNLIGNATKFTREGGVLVKACMDRSDLVIAVTDTGPGLGEEEMSAIFGAFEQTGEAMERSGGTGLGLSISASIMTALGGSLSVSSRRQAGSTFTLRLPVRGVEEKTGQDAPRAMRLKASRVVLLAPAGPAANAIIATLETLGARCHHVTSAPEAAQALKGTEFTDIIVDHRLAPAFMRAVPARETGKNAGPRRIFLVNPEERTTRPRGDFDAWLIRPLREKTLADVLTGRLKGVEKRDALNDNRPMPGFATAAPQQARKTPGGLNVLLAEDDPVNAMLTRSALEKAGHRVTHVTDFGEVLAAMMPAAALRPDLLVTDLSMPGGEGLDVIGKIRAAEGAHGLSRVPVLVLTADRRRQLLQRALLEGADAVLEKPATPERLMEEISIVRALCGVRRSHG